MAVNFSEEAIRDMYNLYSNSLEEAHGLVERVVGEIESTATASKYEQLVNLAKSSVTFYNETLKAAALQALDEWRNGPASCSAFMRDMKAGEGAIARARQQEEEIENEIQSWKTVDGSSLQSIDTTFWEGDKDTHFQDIQDAIGRFEGDMESLRSEYVSRIDSKEQENLMYGHIKLVVMQTLAVIEKGFTAGVGASFRNLAEKYGETEQQREKILEEAVEGTAQRATTIAESASSELRDVVNRLFG